MLQKQDIHTETQPFTDDQARFESARRKAAKLGMEATPYFLERLMKIVPYGYLLGIDKNYYDEYFNREGSLFNKKLGGLHSDVAKLSFSESQSYKATLTPEGIRLNEGVAYNITRSHLIVIAANKECYIIPDVLIGMHVNAKQIVHSSVQTTETGHKQVLFAGHVDLCPTTAHNNNGLVKITRLTGNSGHYKPKERHLFAAIRLLQTCLAEECTFELGGDRTVSSGVSPEGASSTFSPSSQDFSAEWANVFKKRASYYKETSPTLLKKAYNEHCQSLKAIAYSSPPASPRLPKLEEESITPPPSSALSSVSSASSASTASNVSFTIPPELTLPPLLQRFKRQRETCPTSDDISAFENPLKKLRNPDGRSSSQR